MRKCPRRLLCFQWLWWNQLLWLRYCQYRCRAWLRMTRMIFLLLKAIHSSNWILCSNHNNDPYRWQYFTVIFVLGTDSILAPRSYQPKSSIDNSGNFEAGTYCHSLRRIVQCQRIKMLDLQRSSWLLLLSWHIAVLGTVHTQIQQVWNCWKSLQKSLRLYLNLQQWHRRSTSKSTVNLILKCRSQYRWRSIPREFAQMFCFSRH